MSQLALNQVAAVESTNSEWNRLCRWGGIVAWIQLVCVLFTIIVVSTLGAEPTTAAEYFDVLQNNRVIGLLRLDFTTLLLISLFPFVSFAIYAALRHQHQAYAALAATLIIIGMLLALSSHSAFSMMHLSEQYAEATTTTQKGTTADDG